MSIDLTISNAGINRVTNVKFLGLHLHENLDWEMHACKLVKELSAKCYQLRSLRGTLDMATLRTVYFAHAASRMRYCIALWGCSRHADDVFKAQKRIIRAMTGAFPLDSCRPLFKRLRILPVCCLYILDVLVYAFGNRHRYSFNQDMHSHNTRCRGNIRLPFPTCEKFRASPEYVGSSLLNGLPLQMRNCETVKQFKKQLLSLLTNECFYSIDEFVEFLSAGGVYQFLNLRVFFLLLFVY